MKTRKVVTHDGSSAFMDALEADRLLFPPGINHAERSPGRMPPRDGRL
jgi:hypothetical protein